MHRMSASACVDAPAAVVWEHLARLDQIHLWTDLIHDARIEGACHHGVGTERVCELGAGRSNRERVIAWDEGRSYTYVSFDAPMMKEARNTWSVTPMGDRTLVRTDAEIVFRGGWFGRALGYVLVPLLGWLMPNPLVKFKFWVENGRPYVGKARALPVPLPGC